MGGLIPHLRPHRPVVARRGVLGAVRASGLLGSRPELLLLAPLLLPELLLPELLLLLLLALLVVVVALLAPIPT